MAKLEVEKPRPPFEVIVGLKEYKRRNLIRNVRGFVRNVLKNKRFKTAALWGSVVLGSASLGAAGMYVFGKTENTPTKSIPRSEEPMLPEEVKILQNMLNQPFKTISCKLACNAAIHRQLYRGEVENIFGCQWNEGDTLDVICAKALDRPLNREEQENLMKAFRGRIAEMIRTP